MKTKCCNICGSDRYEEKCIEYLYRQGGKCLLVPDTLVDLCRECGMVYYDAAILKEIERHFFTVQNQSGIPANCIRMPTKTLAHGKQMSGQHSMQSLRKLSLLLNEASLSAEWVVS